MIEIKFNKVSTITVSRSEFNLVDQLEYGTNQPYLVDFIALYLKPKLLPNHEINHLRRCRVESISAIQIEEAVVGRLKELANDRVLIEELAKNALHESRERKDYEKSIMASHEQEQRKLEQKLNNLLEAIAETDDKAVRLSLTEKVRDFQEQADKGKLVLSSLKEQQESAGNVVDVSSAFLLLKSFRKDFEMQNVSAQTEILRDIVRSIDVKEDGIFVKIYGVNSGNSLRKGPALCRSAVRTVFKLVDPTRVELVTYPCHGHMIPTSPWAPEQKKTLVKLLSRCKRDF